jgi:hypothetical protein
LKNVSPDIGESKNLKSNVETTSSPTVKKKKKEKVLKNNGAAVNVAENSEQDLSIGKTKEIEMREEVEKLSEIGICDHKCNKDSLILFFFYKFLIFNLAPNGCKNRTFLKRHTSTIFIFSAKIVLFFSHIYI